MSLYDSISMTGTCLAMTRLSTGTVVKQAVMVADLDTGTADKLHFGSDTLVPNARGPLPLSISSSHAVMTLDLLNGYLGVRTAAPTARLDVSGGALFGTLGVSGTVPHTLFTKAEPGGAFSYSKTDYTFAKWAVGLDLTASPPSLRVSFIDVSGNVVAVAQTAGTMGGA